jgi:hypothetical protein
MMSGMVFRLRLRECRHTGASGDYRRKKHGLHYLQSF